MSIEKFIELIKRHPVQLGGREPLTDLQKLSFDLAKQGQSSVQKNEVEGLIMALIENNNLNQFNDWEIAGLCNFIIDSIFDFNSNVFLRKLKNYLKYNLKEETELRKRAFLIKLIVSMNKGEFSPTSFVDQERELVKAYPWIYLDIVAQSGMKKLLQNEIIDIFQDLGDNEKSFADFMVHLDLWWKNGLLSNDKETKLMMDGLQRGFQKVKLTRELLDYFEKWMYAKELKGVESENFEMVRNLSEMINLNSIKCARREMQLAH